MKYLPRLASNHILLISSSQVARITGVSHCAWSLVNFLLNLKFNFFQHEQFANLSLGRHIFGVPFLFGWLRETEDQRKGSPGPVHSGTCRMPGISKLHW
jgi:hypothetical protein